jgi:hypothetical protein
MYMLFPRLVCVNSGGTLYVLMTANVSYCSMTRTVIEYTVALL